MLHLCRYQSLMTSAQDLLSYESLFETAVKKEETGNKEK